MSDSIVQFENEVKAARMKMAENRYTPRYHYVAPLVFMNDPNGLCFFKGYWHMFYQSKKNNGPYQWGHAYSKDMLQWTDMPIAIPAGPYETHCFSGAVCIDGDRAVATYFGVNAGIMIAVSDDPMLEKWTKLNDGHPVIPEPITPEEKAKYILFDPYIWKNGDKFNLISGKYRIDPVSKKRERDGFLFESDDLVNWTYLHPFLDHDVIQPHGDDLACPYFVPLEDKHVIFHFSHRSGPKYIIGNYDNEKNLFRVTDGDKLTTAASTFGGLLAPSAFPESEKSIRLIYNISWNKTMSDLNLVMSLPRSVSFLDGHKDVLAFKPIDDTETLRETDNAIRLSETVLEANREFVIDGVNEDSGEFVFEFENKNIPALEIRVLRSANAEEYTSISIYRQRGNTYFKTIKHPEFGYRKSHESVVVLDTLHSSRDDDSSRRIPEIQSAYIAPEENLKVRVFVDKSLVEVFVNDRIATVARVNPVLNDSTGVSVTPIGQPIKLISFYGYHMKSVY